MSTATTPILRPFQAAGAVFLAARGRGLLADSMGLGKTPQALTALAQVHGPALAGARVLIVAPLATALGWQREAVRWLPQAPPLVIWRRKDAIPASGPAFGFVAWTDLAMRLADILAGSWDVVVADEAHRAKAGKRSQMGKALTGAAKQQHGVWTRDRGVADVVQRLWMLTGTPMPNGRPLELLPLLDALHVVGHPGALLRKQAYMDRFCAEPCRWAPSGVSYEGARNLPELQDLLGRSGAFLRREPGDVAGELPALQRIPTPLAISGRLPQLSEEAEQAAMEAVAAGRAPEFEEWSAFRRALGVAKAAAVADWACDHLEGAGPGAALVVFVHHLEVGRAIAGKLAAELGQPVEFASGEDSAEERQAKVDRFAAPTGPAVLVASMAACGTGMNGMQLRTAVCAFAELPVETATMAQAEGRIRRMRPDGTQVAQALAFQLLAPVALEERIAGLLSAKADAVEATFGHAEQAAHAAAPAPIPAAAAPAVEPQAEGPADIDPLSRAWSWAKDSRTGGWLARCDHEASDGCSAAWAGLEVDLVNRSGVASTVELVARVAGGAQGGGWSVWTFKQATSAAAKVAKDRRYLAYRAKGRNIELPADRPLTAEEQEEADWCAQAARQLTAADPDRAAVRNAKGWSAVDGLIGRVLAAVPGSQWDLPTLAFARLLLPKYVRQVGRWPGPVAM